MRFQCPKCGTDNLAVGHLPKPGHLSLCSTCDSVAVLSSDMQLIAIDEAQLPASLQEKIRQWREAFRKFKQRVLKTQKAMMN